MNIQDDVNQVVIHELIHAYDDCRAANLDWANCAHHACSEVGVIVNNGTPFDECIQMFSLKFVSIKSFMFMWNRFVLAI